MLEQVQLGQMPYAMKFDHTYTPPSSYGSSRLKMAGVGKHQGAMQSMHINDQLMWMKASIPPPSNYDHNVHNSVLPLPPIIAEYPASKGSIKSTRSHSSQASSTISPQFRIPDTVKTPHDCIADLAAEVACLFWFENLATIKWVERGCPSTAEPVTVSPLCKPTEKFIQWLETTLTTTGITQNVIFLALLLIYRFKTKKPKVMGQIGSEYRLMTVALMLGNKFLDDNTYTNKTWSEVTNIKLKELHGLEVEFLSHLKYDLFTSKERWEDWHGTLSTFASFVYKFVRSPSPSKPSAASSHTPLMSTSGNTTPYSMSNTPVSHISYTPSLPSTHTLKRSRDEDVSEPPAKRHLPNLLHIHTTMGQFPIMPAATAAPRMTLPSLTMPSFPTFSSGVQLPTSLPPPGMNAMSMVYPTHQPRPQAYLPPIPPMVSHPSLENFRQLSPHADSSAGLSPTGHYPMNQSPSFYLAQRSSPFRPVNQIHYLSSQSHSPAFDPSSSLHSQQMQYHPLGHPGERHVGQIPYFSQQAWPQNHNIPQMIYPAQS
jgi:hypothetical protein